MIALRRAADRGHADHGWLDTKHTFSFAGYHDPAHMGFRSLRVMNEDIVAPGQGFGKHPHRDMEIVTYILSGQLEHADSMGHGSILQAGQWQRITAGTGILHSEFNPSPREAVHLYQIWIKPDRHGLTPSYEQKGFDGPTGRLLLIASPDGQVGSMLLHQDALLYLARLDAGQALTHELAPGRQAWVQVMRGEVTLNGHALQGGDGAALSAESAVSLQANGLAEVMLFDLA